MNFSVFVEIGSSWKSMTPILKMNVKADFKLIRNHNNPQRVTVIHFVDLSIFVPTQYLQIKCIILAICLEPNVLLLLGSRQ